MTDALNPQQGEAVMKLNEEEVTRLRDVNRRDRNHKPTSEIKTEVARKQVIDALGGFSFTDPALQHLVEILRFAFEHGVL